MSNITLTMVHHHGESLALGRNVAVKLMLEKSEKRADFIGMWSVARVLWTRTLQRPRMN